MSFSSFCNLGIVLPANCWQTDVRQVPWKRPGQGRLQIPNSLWGDKYQRGNKTSRKPKVNAEIQIPQEEKKNHFQCHCTALESLCKNGCFTSLSLGPCFITMFLAQSTALGGISPPPRKDKWCKHLPGDPACSPHYKMSQQKDKKLLLHFKSGVSDASGWDSTGEIWTLRNKFPYFLTGNLCMTE